MTFGGSVSGAFSITQTGSGTGGVSFTGSSLAFNLLNNTGSGTLTVGTTGSTVTANGVTVGSTGTIVLGGGSTAVPNAISGAMTIGGGTYLQPNSYTSPFTIAGGAITLSPGAVYSGTGLTIGAASNSGQLNLGANASLSINTTSEVDIGFTAAGSAANTGAIINGQSGSSLTINVTGGANLFIGGGNPATSGLTTNTQVSLGSGTNTLSTTGTGIVWVGNNPAPNLNGQDGNDLAHGVATNTNLGQNTVNLGSGVNNISTTTLNISGAKTPGSVYLANPGVLANFNQPTQESPVIRRGPQSLRSGRFGAGEPQYRR